LPISIPSTAIPALSLGDMACSLVFGAPCQFRLLAGAGARPDHPISGHERAAFAAMHAPDVLYVVRDRWLSGKPMKRREFQTRDAEMNLARFIGELSN